MDLGEIKGLRTSKLIEICKEQRLIRNVRPVRGGYDFICGRHLLSLTIRETKWFCVGLLTTIANDLQEEHRR